MCTVQSSRSTLSALRWPRRLVHALGLVALLGGSAGLASAQSSGNTLRSTTSDQGHGLPLHVSTRWKECSIQLDPALTQSAWRQFTREAGVVAYFRPLTDAQSLGRGRWEISVLQWQTGIHDDDAAWNDTFVHPDSTHWLFEGQGLAFPGLTGRVGVTDRTDVGVYFTKNANANYGFYGLQLQQRLVGDDAGAWSAAARVNAMSLFGPDDVDLQVYGADLVASRRFQLVSGRLLISPYAVVSASLTRTHEKSALVTLANEQVAGTQGAAGVQVQLAGVRVAMEYGVSTVRNVSLKVGFGRGR